MKINQLKAGAMLSYLNMGLGFLVSIVYTPIMLRLLGQNEYGLYNLVASVVAYLGILNFGFGSAYVRYYCRFKVHEDQENISKLNGMFLIVFSLIGIIAVIAGTILVLNIEMIFGNNLIKDELITAKILMTIMIVNIGFSFPSTVINSYITANEKFVFQKILQSIKIFASPFLILPILFLGYGSIGMAVVTTLINLFIEIINFLFCYKKLNINFSFKQIDFSLMKEITIFSSYIFIGIVVNQLNWNVDKYLLGLFKGTKDVAIYSLAAQILTYYVYLSVSISNVFVPRVNNIIFSGNDNLKLTDLFIRIGRIQFIILTFVMSWLTFFGKEFIVIWAGSIYEESFLIVLILLFPVTVPLIQNLGIEIQRAKNMHKFRSWLYLIIAIVNVLTSIPLAKIYGVIGVASATAVTQIIGNTIIMNIYYQKKIGINIILFWKEILMLMRSTVPPIILGIIIFFNVDLSRLFVFILYSIFYLFMYVLSIWFWGVNKYEKDLLKKPIMNIIDYYAH